MKGILKKVLGTGSLVGLTVFATLAIQGQISDRFGNAVVERMQKLPRNYCETVAWHDWCETFGAKRNWNLVSGKEALDLCFAGTTMYGTGFNAPAYAYELRDPDSAYDACKRAFDAGAARGQAAQEALAYSYLKNHPQLAVSRLTTLADRGSHRAALSLHRIHLNGIYVEPNMRDAAIYLGFALGGGSAEADYYASWFARTEACFSGESKIGRAVFERQFESTQAIRALFDLQIWVGVENPHWWSVPFVRNLREDVFCKGNWHYDLHMRFLTQAADKGLPAANLQLAWQHAEGRDIGEWPQYEVAAEYHRRGMSAIDASDPIDLYYVGAHSINEQLGLGAPEHDVLRKSIEHGGVDSATRLAWQLNSFCGYICDTADALELEESQDLMDWAISQGAPYAYELRAYDNLYHAVSTRDLGRILGDLEKSAFLGNKRAARFLARLYTDPGKEAVPLKYGMGMSAASAEMWHSRNILSGECGSAVELAWLTSESHKWSWFKFEERFPLAALYVKEFGCDYRTDGPRLAFTDNFYTGSLWDFYVPRIGPR